MEPARRAELDQLQAEVTDKAVIVARYWRKLVDEGVEDYCATELATDFARTLIFGTGDPQPTDPQPTEHDTGDEEEQTS